MKGNTNMKKIFAIIFGLSLYASTLFAQTTYTTAPTTATNQVVSTSGMQFALLTITAGASPVTVSFYDSPYGTTVWTNAAYTSRITYTTNITQTYTNREGIIFTNSISNAKWTTTSTVAANTNNSLTAVLTTTIPASGVYMTTDKKVFSTGVTLATDTNCTINLQYFPLF